MDIYGLQNIVLTVVESLKVTKQGTSETAKIGTEYTALNWNIGYAGLDKDEDFFMDWWEDGSTTR